MSNYSMNMRRLFWPFIACCIIMLFVACLSQRTTRIFLIGDSTMADKPLADNPEHGWGQMFPMFFSQYVHIMNYAVNGRSTKNFLAEGHWKKVYDQLQPDDYVFIQFGHNDAKKEDTLRYAAPHPDYKDNLKRIIHETREKSAIPILLTPITRRDFDKNGQYVGTHGEYPAVMKEVAKEENVPLIDMFEKTKQLVIKLGDAPSKELYLAGVKQNEFRLWNKKRDNTHFTRTGAIQMASFVVEGIKELHLPLEKELIPAQTKNLVGEGKVVGLDYFFNNEWRSKKDSVLERWHYVWEDTTDSGFSQLGRSIDLLGAELDSLQSSPTDSSLNRFSIYIIVDPDTPDETKPRQPNYISEDAIKVIVPWVERGGVLVLMGNDKGNMEFEHLNHLSEHFDIHFNEDCYHKVIGSNYETGKNDHLPAHPIFKDVKQIFMKEICSLKIEKPAKPILTENDLVLMASARVGKGLVFAVGDPWLYNEYMDTRRLPIDYENSKTGRNLFQWLLSNAAIPAR
ncbi:MAG: rhamnogalacturonan acetylesterase [Bacteroidota bacterium]